MNSAPHLLAEDRPEFERVLDEALRTAHQRPVLAELARRHGEEKLRAMALAAALPIASGAAAEYQRFTALREELRNAPQEPAADDGPGGGASAPGEEEEPGAEAVGTAETAADEATEATEATGTDGTTDAAETAETADTGRTAHTAAGPGVVAVLSVLAPVLAGTAALIFLLVGYALQLLTSDPSLAESMRGTGWAFAALAAATALAGMVGLLFAAVRNGARTGHRTGPGPGGRTAIRTPSPAVPLGRPAPGGLAGAVAEAREDWREALLERGIVPFLQEAFTERRGGVTAAEPLPSPDDQPRTPRLGYTHPRYSSPASPTSGDASPRPRFSSPDYTSPDYDAPDFTGPDQQPE